MSLKQIFKIVRCAGAVGAVIPLIVLAVGAMLHPYQEPMAIVLMSQGLWPFFFGFAMAVDLEAPFSLVYLLLLFIGMLLNAIIYASVAAAVTWTYSRFKYVAVITFIPILVYWMWLASGTRRFW